jgi:hypothetical protein
MTHVKILVRRVVKLVMANIAKTMTKSATTVIFVLMAIANGIAALGRPVAAAVVAVIPAAMGFAAVQGKAAVTARAVIRSGLKRHILQSTSLVLLLLNATIRQCDATE